MKNLAAIPPLLLLTLTLACGGGTSDSNSAPNSDGGTAVGCEASKDSITIALKSIPSQTGSGTTLDSYRLGPLRSGPEGALLSLHRDQGDDSVEVASWDGSDAVSSLASELETSAYQVRTAPVDFGQGRHCALYDGTPKSLSLACNDGTVEESGFSVRQDSLYPVVTSDGSLSVFTQTFSSYTEVVRSPEGEWREIEKYESSVSMPTDAHLVDGVSMSCFVSNSDRAVIDFAGGETLSAASVRDCKLAPTSSAVHVLTDEGYAAIPRTSLGNGERFETAAVELAEPALTFLALGDTAYAIVQRNEELLAVSMPDGVVHSILSVAPDARDLRVSYDPIREKLYVASSTVDNPIDEATQRLDLEALCLEQVL